MTATGAPGTADDGAGWAAVRALFDALVELPPAARGARLDDPALPAALRREVAALLAHADAAGGGTAGTAAFLDAPAAQLLGSATGGPPAAPTLPPGTRLGAWRVLALLGAGGMGEVYRAERADGRYQAEAAIKIVRRPGGGAHGGTPGRAALERFAAEQQVLARLNHPHIARLFDAGLAPDGQPYFVMELVDGRPITAAAHGLGLRERVALFLQLADAVAHAHRQLLVHRDLKPGNVLVDAAGQVKLLDFGIAQAIEADAAAAGGAPAPDARAYTPHYASPEQVRGEPLGTATDVYSLGVMLYELLTGQRPYGRGATTPQQAADAVLQEPPEPPRQLRGDLGLVLLKALEKSPERRYASVDALAADLRAWRAQRPVAAHPATPGYAAGRWVARNPLATAAGALALLALVGGLAATTWQARRAEAARAEAEQRLAEVREVTRKLVFRFGDAVTYLPGGMALKEDLLRDTLATLDRLAALPGVGDPLLADVAATYGRLAELQLNDAASLGKPEDALANADKALAVAARLSPAHVHDWTLVRWLAAAHVVRNTALTARGDAAGAAAALDAGTAYLERALQRDDGAPERVYGLGAQMYLRIVGALRDAARVAYDPAALPGVLRTFDEVAAGYERLRERGPAIDLLDASGRPEEPKARRYIDHQIATARGQQALLLLRHDRLADARRAVEQALPLRRQNVALEPHIASWGDQLMVDANTLAVIALRQGDAPTALAAARESWAAAERLAAEHGPQSKWARSLPVLAQQHGRALALAGEPAAALPMLQRARAHWEAALGPAAAAPPADAAAALAQADARRRLAWMLAEQARALAALGRSAEAAPLLARALALAAQVPAEAPQHRDALLTAADAWAQRAGLAAPGSAARRQAGGEARRLLGEAAALRPLAEDQQRLREAAEKAG